MFGSSFSLFARFTTLRRLIRLATCLACGGAREVPLCPLLVSYFTRTVFMSMRMASLPPVRHNKIGHIHFFPGSVSGGYRSGLELEMSVTFHYELLACGRCSLRSFAFS